MTATCNRPARHRGEHRHYDNPPRANATVCGAGLDAPYVPRPERTRLEPEADKIVRLLEESVDAYTFVRAFHADGVCDCPRHRAYCAYVTVWHRHHTIVDASRAEAMPTGRVIVRHRDLSDAALLRSVAAALPNKRGTFGATVTRGDDGLATVAYWND